MRIEGAEVLSSDSTATFGRSHRTWPPLGDGAGDARVKGRSSRKIQMEFPDLRKRYWGMAAFWRPGVDISATTSAPAM